LIVAAPFVDAKSEKRYAADILANALGGGTSSRLWQKVREEKGLAYSVGASAAMYQDLRRFLDLRRNFAETVEQVLDISLKELRSVVKNGILRKNSIDERAIVASILLGLEDSGVRAGTPGAARNGARQTSLHRGNAGENRSRDD
jgi:predicted Zn-dependent peptidase